MHKLSRMCVQPIHKLWVVLVDTFGALAAVCTKRALCAAYAKVTTRRVHTPSLPYSSVIFGVMHTVHTPYINQSILNRLLIINKHSGELL